MLSCCSLFEHMFGSGADFRIAVVHVSSELSRGRLSGLMSSLPLRGLTAALSFGPRNQWGRSFVDGIEA